MKQLTLGTNGPVVSAVGFGAMSFTGIYGTPDDSQDQAILNRALELGINFIDTANIYGASEEIIGRFLPARRAEVDVMSAARDRSAVGSAWDGAAGPRSLNDRIEDDD